MGISGRLGRDSFMLFASILLVSVHGISPVNVHGAWLHFQRARVRVCVQCSCVQNTGREVSPYH